MLPLGVMINGFQLGKLPETIVMEEKIARVKELHG